MKISKNLKNFKKTMLTYQKDTNQNLNEIIESYNSDIIKYQEDLLLRICNDHNLSYEGLHRKYIKKTSNKYNLIESDIDLDEEKDIEQNLNSLENSISKNLLIKKNINNSICFVEDTEGGSIYNKEVIKIGEVKKGKYLLY